MNNNQRHVQLYVMFEDRDKAEAYAQPNKPHSMTKAAEVIEVTDTTNDRFRYENAYMVSAKRADAIAWLMGDYPRVSAYTVLDEDTAWQGHFVEIDRTDPEKPLRRLAPHYPRRFALAHITAFVPETV